MDITNYLKEDKDRIIFFKDVFVLSEGMQEYFNHNENKWDILVDKLYIGIYGNFLKCCK